MTFVEYVNPDDPVTMPSVFGIVFIVIVGVMIFGQIWYPKRDS